MTATDIAASNLYWPNTVPFRYTRLSTTSTGTTDTIFQPAWGNGGIVVLGFDLVAWNANPVQCFCRLDLPTNCAVFYDSQSAGEGNGIRFTWRGQIPLGPSESFSVYFSAVAAITWSYAVHGLLTPFPVNLWHL